MNFLNFIRSKIFTSNCHEEEGKTISTTSLQKVDGDTAFYQQWLKYNRHKTLLDAVSQAAQKRTGCPLQKDKAICFLMIPTVNGFTFRFDANRWVEDDFKYLVEFIRQQLTQKLDYELSESTQEKVQYTDHIETVDRYSFNSKNPQNPYHKVLLRLSYTDQSIVNIKFCATMTANQKGDFNAHFDELWVKIAK